MKTLIATLAAVAAVTAVAAPAAAQPYGHDRYDHYDRYDRWEGRRENINARQADLWRRMEHADRRGLLTNAEYRQTRQGFDNFARIEARMRVDGLDRWERAELNRRLDRLETSLEWRIANSDYARGAYARR